MRAVFGFLVLLFFVFTQPSISKADQFTSALSELVDYSEENAQNLRNFIEILRSNSPESRRYLKSLIQSWNYTFTPERQTQYQLKKLDIASSQHQYEMIWKVYAEVFKKIKSHYKSIAKIPSDQKEFRRKAVDMVLYEIEMHAVDLIKSLDSHYIKLEQSLSKEELHENIQIFLKPRQYFRTILSKIEGNKIANWRVPVFPVLLKDAKIWAEALSKSGLSNPALQVAYEELFNLISLYANLLPLKTDPKSIILPRGIHSITGEKITLPRALFNTIEGEIKKHQLYVYQEIPDHFRSRLNNLCINYELNQLPPELTGLINHFITTSIYSENMVSNIAKDFGTHWIETVLPETRTSYEMNQKSKQMRTSFPSYISSEILRHNKTSSKKLKTRATHNNPSEKGKEVDSDSDLESEDSKDDHREAQAQLGTPFMTTADTDANSAAESKFDHPDETDVQVNAEDSPPTIVDLVPQVAKTTPMEMTNSEASSQSAETAEVTEVDLEAIETEVKQLGTHEKMMTEQKRIQEQQKRRQEQQKRKQEQQKQKQEQQKQKQEQQKRKREQQKRKREQQKRKQEQQKPTHSASEAPAVKTSVPEVSIHLDGIAAQVFRSGTKQRKFAIKNDDFKVFLRAMLRHVAEAEGLDLEKLARVTNKKGSKGFKLPYRGKNRNRQGSTKEYTIHFAHNGSDAISPYDLWRYLGSALFDAGLREPGVVICD